MKIKRRKWHCFLNCFLFIQRGGQKVSKVAIGLLVIGWTFAFVSLFVAVAQKISWLDYLYYFSYIKTGCHTCEVHPSGYTLPSHTTKCIILSTHPDIIPNLTGKMQTEYLLPCSNEIQKGMFIRCDFPTKESKCMKIGGKTQKQHFII